MQSTKKNDNWTRYLPNIFCKIGKKNHGKTSYVNINLEKSQYINPQWLEFTFINERSLNVMLILSTAWRSTVVLFIHKEPLINTMFRIANKLPEETFCISLRIRRRRPAATALLVLKVSNHYRHTNCLQRTAIPLAYNWCTLSSKAGVGGTMHCSWKETPKHIKSELLLV